MLIFERETGFSLLEGLGSLRAEAQCSTEKAFSLKEMAISFKETGVSLSAEGISFTAEGFDFREMGFGFTEMVVSVRKWGFL